MLTEEAIRRALHASRVVPLEVANPHGPLGLEQLAAAVVALRQTAQSQTQPERVSQPIELPLRTWEKLRDLAAATSQAGTPPVSAGELADQYFYDFVFGMQETGVPPAEIRKAMVAHGNLVVGVWIFNEHKTAKT